MDLFHYFSIFAQLSLFHYRSM